MREERHEKEERGNKREMRGVWRKGKREGQEK